MHLNSRYFVINILSQIEIISNKKFVHLVRYKKGVDRWIIWRELKGCGKIEILRNPKFAKYLNDGAK